MPKRAASLFVLILFFTLLGCNEETVLSAEAYGPVVFGSQLVDVERMLNVKASREHEDPFCYYVQLPQYPGIEFMIEKGIITRAEVNADVPNILSIKVGTPFEQIKKFHPNIIVKPHKYISNGYYLVSKTVNGKNAIVMEVVDDKVAYIRAGIEPSVEYVEGCL
jgi:hypothetical protein